MILRRLSAELRAQNWTTIGIELAIVIVGVFIGTQVSNWNEGRLQKRQTQRMLEQLRPELALDIDYFESVRAYYAVTKKYADIALAGGIATPGSAMRNSSSPRIRRARSTGSAPMRRTGR